jgi:hypothetical protein
LQTYTKKITAQFTPYSPQFSEHPPSKLINPQNITAQFARYFPKLPRIPSTSK